MRRLTLNEPVLKYFLILPFFCFVVFFSCEKPETAEETQEKLFHSYVEIPGITDEETALIESLKNKYNHFTFGMIPTTEAFKKENSELGGYDALLCEWLTGLFGIRFQLQLLSSNELITKLHTGEIDFSGNMMPGEDRKNTYYMTDTIAERKFIKIRLDDSRSDADIMKERPLRYAFSDNTPVEEAVASVTEQGVFESVSAGDFTQAYNILLNGEADAYIASSAAEAAFIDYDDIIIEDYFPLVFNPVSMATAKKELEPVIAVVNKALRNGALPHLSRLYNQGYDDYQKHKLTARLTPEERMYIKANKIIPVAAFNSDYPLSFYNEREHEWQGIYFDLLDEISSLTGLSFEVAHNEKAAWREINELMLSGNAAVIPELVKTKELEKYFTWSDILILNDYYALISKADHHNITLNEILHVKIGLARGTIYAEMFKQWFPYHKDTVEYDSADLAFKGLIDGEVDMVMTTQRRLMHLTHYQEITGYKTNLVFNQPIESRFAFNKNEAVLKSIIDKALKLINIDGKIVQWTQKTYDYRVKLVEAQRPWLLGAIALALVVLSLILSMFYKSRDEGRKLALLVKETNEANRIKNISIISMETILNGIDAMIYVTNPKTSKILFMNDSMKRHFNIDGDCTGKLCYKILQKDLDKMCDFCPCHQLDIEPEKTVVWEEHSTLTKKVYHNTDRYIEWPNGEIVHIQHSVDTTKLVAAREFAERSNRYKSSFLANMSHEIRTPMNTILGIAEIQLQKENLTPEYEDVMNKIYESGELLVKIINDILDLSKIEAGKLELVSVKYDIPSLINDTAQLNCLRFENKPIIFSLRVDENTPHDLFGDELRIKQILNNVLSNAFKYTDEGKVEFSVTYDPGKTDDENVTIIFGISDTGHGMTQNQIDSLFDEYTRFNQETNRAVVGTGLGMNITMRLINLMNGKITVGSEPGKGSVFTISIPQKRIGSDICGTETAERLKNFRYQGTSIKKKTQFLREYMPYGSVLIVDDVDSNIYVTKGMLAPYGLKIETASSGFEAVNKIKNGSAYDIIFMDHMMPEMDGIVTAKILRGMGYKNFIIALTANAIIGRAEMFMKNGFDGFISKPIDSRELNLLLNDFIRNKKPPEVIEEARKKQLEMNKKSITVVAEPHNLKMTKERETLLIQDAENAVKVMRSVYEKLPDTDNAQMELFITTVHGMKSVLANIGEEELSANALNIEKAGEKRDMKYLTNKTPDFINALEKLADKYKSNRNENNAEHELMEISAENTAYLREKLAEIKKYCEIFDKKAAKTVLDGLRQKTWTSDVSNMLDEIALDILHSSFKKAALNVQEFIDKSNF